jgi:hypothetical protein
MARVTLARSLLATSWVVQLSDFACQIETVAALLHRFQIARSIVA